LNPIQAGWRFTAVCTTPSITTPGKPTDTRSYLLCCRSKSQIALTTALGLGGRGVAQRALWVTGLPEWSRTIAFMPLPPMSMQSVAGSSRRFALLLLFFLLSVAMDRTPFCL
jgi:hypothetical protein